MHEVQWARHEAAYEIENAKEPNILSNKDERPVSKHGKHGYHNPKAD